MTRAKSRTDQPASDNDLSEHEWRLKMAAEGKAIYVPGNTVEEMKAILAAKSKSSEIISRRMIALTDDEWDGLDTAIPDIIEILSYVKNVLLDLSEIEKFNILGVDSMLRLVFRAVKSTENKEVHTLDRLGMATGKYSVQHTD